MNADKVKANDVALATHSGRHSDFDHASAVFAKDGTLYFSRYAAIYKVGADGYVVRIAGTPFSTVSAGDYGPAIAATFKRSPTSIAVGPDGALYVAEPEVHKVRRIGNGGLIHTIAGDGFQDEFGWGRYNGDGIPATSASLYFPIDIALDIEGNLYVVDRDNFRIRKVDPAGIISTVAGTGVGADEVEFSEGVGNETSIPRPKALAVAKGGGVYFATGGAVHHRSADVLFSISPDGTIRPIAGHEQTSRDISTRAGYGGPASKAVFS